MIRAFLVDDEPPARARMRQLLAEAGDVLVVGEASSADEARVGIAATQPDVVFLDIEMPEGSGTALAATLAEPRPFIVFATAFDQYAVHAFSVDAMDYLLKPITRGRLAGTLSRVRDRLSGRSDLEREMIAASAAQAQLLPRALPAVPGFDCAAATAPAGAVGGDFFLGQRLANGRFSLALGDVSGKGMPAGLVASSVQARLETIASRGEGTAADVVRDVNRALSGTMESARYATLAYVEIDPDTAEVQIVNAGHPPLVSMTVERTRALVSSSGPAIGMFPEAHYDVHTLTLARGSVLVAYSDGVTEAVDEDGEELGEAHLVEAIARHLPRTAHEICRAVLDLARDHRGGAPSSDDVTALVIKRVAGSEGPGFSRAIQGS